MVIIIIIIIIIMLTYSLNKHLLRSCLYQRCPSCIGPIWRLFFLVHTKRDRTLFHAQGPEEFRVNK